MALPKRQHSKQRGRKRRTHQGVELPSFGVCSHCGASVITHRVCPACGFYKGNQVIEIKQKKEKKKK